MAIENVLSLAIRINSQYWIANSRIVRGWPGDNRDVRSQARADRAVSRLRHVMDGAERPRDEFNLKEQ